MKFYAFVFLSLLVHFKGGSRCGYPVPVDGNFLDDARYFLPFARRRKTGSGFGVWGLGGIPNGIRPLIFQPQKGNARDPLLIRWDLCPRRGGSTLGVLVLRHSETTPAEDVAPHLNRTLFDEVCLAPPAGPTLRP